MLLNKKEVAETPLNPSYENYFSLIKGSIFHPIEFIQKNSLNPPLKYFFWFYLVNLSLGLLIKLFLDTLLKMKIQLLFLGVVQVMFYISVNIILEALICLVIFLVTRILGGKLNLKEVIKIFYLSSFPLLLVWLPYIWIPATVGLIILIILGLHYFGKLSFLKSAVAALSPFLIMALVVSGFFQL